MAQLPALTKELSSFKLSCSSTSSPCVVKHMTDIGAKDLHTAFRDARIVALDAEGVDLSRKGRISIVQIATAKQVFLLDVLDKVWHELGVADFAPCRLIAVLDREAVHLTLHQGDAHLGSDPSMILTSLGLMP